MINKGETDKAEKKGSLKIIGWTAVITFTATMLFAFYLFSDTFSSTAKATEEYKQLLVLRSYVDKYFYKNVEDDSAMEDGLLKGYINSLEDKYSRYQSPTEYGQTVKTDSGEFVGIGITATKNSEGHIEVTEVQDISPANKAGLLVGDVIIAVDGNDVVEAGYEESVKNITGEKGTTVTLTLLRDGKKEDIEVTRKVIEISTVYKEMLEGDIGYIRIEHFRMNTSAQFTKNLQELIDAGAKGFVFDLRDNGGGIVQSMEDCLDPLLPEGDIAVATYKDGTTSIICKSDANETNLPMVVLLNENSASASELFAKSLQDFKETKIIGTKSFGKGIMQNTYSLDNGGALTLTVAEIHTTKTPSYHGIGIYPDYEVELNEGVDITDEKHTDDNQFEKAVDVLKEQITD